MSMRILLDETLRVHLIPQTAQRQSICTSQGFFTKFLVEGDLLSGTIFGSRWGWTKMGGLASGTESDGGGSHQGRSQMGGGGT